MPLLIPPKETVVKQKLCLVGEFAVGKTSLVNRHLHDSFQGRYMATIGASIHKVGQRVGTSRVEMTIWDIMGEKGFRELLREAYFEGANGVMAVTDLTRSGDLLELEEWIDAVFRIAGRIPLVVVGNKSDLKEHLRTDEDEVARFAARYDAPYAITSAKTGANVRDAFRSVAEAMVSHV